MVNAWERLPGAAFVEVFNVMTKRVLIASAVLVSTSLLAGCDAFSFFRGSTPGVYKGRPDVHDTEAYEQRREQLRKRVWATQGEVGKPRAL